jgi:hypothetical protein
MKISVSKKTVKISTLGDGALFIGPNGLLKSPMMIVTHATNMMPLKNSCGDIYDKYFAVDLSTGKILYWSNSDCDVIPVSGKLEIGGV